MHCEFKGLRFCTLYKELHILNSILFFNNLRTKFVTFWHKMCVDPALLFPFFQKAMSLNVRRLFFRNKEFRKLFRNNSFEGKHFYCIRFLQIGKQNLLADHVKQKSRTSAFPIRIPIDLFFSHAIVDLFSWPLTANQTESLGLNNAWQFIKVIVFADATDVWWSEDIGSDPFALIEIKSAALQHTSEPEIPANKMNPKSQGN